MSKKIIIISYYWPPAGGPGVQRWLKFGKYLHGEEIEAHILTVSPHTASYPITDESLLKEENVQPLYYPSINKKNLESFNKKFFKEYNTYPNHLSLLSYDLLGLIYYLSLKTDLQNIENLFKKKNSFKGKIGIFDIKDNKINHRLNFYKVDDGKIIEIF